MPEASCSAVLRGMLLPLGDALVTLAVDAGQRPVGHAVDDRREIDLDPLGQLSGPFLTCRLGLADGLEQDGRAAAQAEGAERGAGQVGVLRVERDRTVRRFTPLLQGVEDGDVEAS